MRRTTTASLSLAAVFLLVSLATTTEVGAIRLDAGSRAAATQHQQQANVAHANEQGETGLTRKVDAPGERSSSSPAGENSEVGRSVAVAVAVAGQEAVKAAAHRLPEFHEDYYGASVHEPRHH